MMKTKIKIKIMIKRTSRLERLGAHLYWRVGQIGMN